MESAKVPVSQRWSSCRICHNRQCILSLYIYPCECEKDSSVHESCLEKQIKQKPMYEYQRNQNGFLGYECEQCRSTILFREDFKRQSIPCGKQHCSNMFVIIMLIFTLLLSFGALGLFFFFVQGQELYMQIFFGVMVFTVTVFAIIQLRLRMTAKFWRYPGSSARLSEDFSALR